MLSGNGRHRRPRQAPALIVAAGVTGSAIAIPLLGATGASAADGTTWDRVAECESGGSWSADSGNGYYGGLQMTQENWEKYGGLAYAPSPDEASRSQQIAVAEKLLDGQGLAAWPTCGPLSGLSKKSASVEVDTGIGEDTSSPTGSASPDSSPSDDSSGSGGLSNGSPSGKPSASASADPSKSGATSGATSKPSKDAGDSKGADNSDTGKAKADDSDKSGRSEAPSGGSASEAAGTGRHRGGIAEDEAGSGATAGRAQESSGRHASRSADATSDATEGSYTVRLGDSLTSIADSLAVQGGWSELYEVNEKTVGADPDLIHPGQSLEVTED